MATGESAPPRPIWLELAVVLALTVGMSLVGSLWPGAAAHTESQAFTNRHVLGVVAYEVVLAALLVPWLMRRGWSPGAIAGEPGPRDVLRGAGVFLFATGVYALTWLLFALLAPDTARALMVEQRFTGAPATALAVVLVSVINPVFEEFLWLGYLVARIAPRAGWRWAAAISVGLRVSVHAYQGPWALLSMLPIGLAFTWYYGRTRALWPVVVAHVAFDAIGLARRLAAG